MIQGSGDLYCMCYDNNLIQFIEVATQMPLGLCLMVWELPLGDLCLMQFEIALGGFHHVVFEILLGQLKKYLRGGDLGWGSGVI